MDLMERLGRFTQALGLPGYEEQAAGAIAEAFRELTPLVETDALYNVVARMGERGPRFMVTAHQDEIGLMVLSVEEDGCLRFTPLGGVDTRILPAMPVTVYAQGGPLPGVVGAKPPHLLTPAEQKKAAQLKDLYIDLGLEAQVCRERVRPGDLAALTGPLVQLEDGRWAGKTLDDRACVCAMLAAAQWLKRLRAPAQVSFVAASQEEVGSRGATAAAWALEPDVAVVLDVTHGEAPATDKWETFPLDKPTITLGPNVHPALTRLLRQVAQENGVDFSLEPCGHVTYTDAEATQVSRAGVPTVLIGVPLKYMHTTVEMVQQRTIAEAGRLVALFIDELARGWEEIQWY